MKKSILILATILFGFTMNGQELKKNEVDDFTGKTIKLTKTYFVAKGVTSLIAKAGRVKDAENDWYFLYVQPSLDLGCAGSRDSYIIIKFTDGSTIKYQDKADVNCGDNPWSMYVIDPSDFKGKTIDKIRFKQSKLYDDCSTESGTYTINQLLEALK